MSASDKKKAKPTKKRAPTGKKTKVTKTKKVAKADVDEKPKPKKPAPKAKKVAEKKEAPPKAIAKPERVELGPPPLAAVEVRHIDSNSMHERRARGFSFGELASARGPARLLRSAKASTSTSGGGAWSRGT